MPRGLSERPQVNASRATLTNVLQGCKVTQCWPSTEPKVRSLAAGAKSIDQQALTGANRRSNCTTPFRHAQPQPKPRLRRLFRLRPKVVPALQTTAWLRFEKWYGLTGCRRSRICRTNACVNARCMCRTCSPRRTTGKGILLVGTHCDHIQVWNGAQGDSASE